MNRGHKVRPLYIKEIRREAQKLKDSFGITGEYFPIVELIEAMHEREWLELEIVEKELMPDDYGLTFPKRNLIRIRMDVYDKARNGDGFGRFTMAHELGHLTIHREETVYARNEHGGCHQTIEDSEWQADKFAQELLVDTRLLSISAMPRQIVYQSGVSDKAAMTAYKSLLREGVLK